MRRPCLSLLAGLIAFAWGGDVRADAIVRTRAMFSSTIAEYHVEPGVVGVDLEIGAADLEAFANLFPDEVYERLGNEPLPLRERFRRFWEQDFVVSAGPGAPIPARVADLAPGERVLRDEISGEALPRKDQEAETVLRVRLEYDLEGQPDELHLGGLLSSRTAIGFVVYHRGIAVNDFRYLGPSQILDLDWEDPWYSAFRTRNLRRSYFAPMSGFLYVDPYEVRKEIVLRPKDLEHWIDLGLAGRETIPVESQEELKRAVAEFLRVHQPVAIDGTLADGDLAQINFLERTLRTSRVIDPPIELDVNAAILGAIFVYPTDGLPERVEMEWDLFNERIVQIPAAAVDQAGPLPSYLEPDAPILEWRNFLQNPEIPTLRVLEPPPGTVERIAAAVRWPLLLLGLAMCGWCVWRSRLGLALGVSLALLAGGAVTFWIGAGARVSDRDAADVVGGLLYNVYRAFDYREEERIYDTLARSVDGSLLTDLYLETRRGLELASQGGARARVKEIELEDLADTHAAEGGFVVTATWVVRGSVGHWGHIHERRNRYRAQLGIRPVDGSWKLTGVEILEEERL